MKQNNVNGLISFLDNQEYFDEPQKSYDIFLKDKLTGLCDWINNLPKEQKMNKNLIKLIDALRSCLDSAIDDNFAEDLIKDETIKFLESILDSTSHKKVSNTKLLPNSQNLIEG